MLSSPSQILSHLAAWVMLSCMVSPTNCALLTTMAPAASGACSYEVPFSSGQPANVSVVSNSTITLFTTTVQTLSWVGVGFSGNGRMSDPAVPAVIMYSNPDAGGSIEADAFLMEAQTVEGIRALSTNEAALHGIELLSWDMDIDALTNTTTLTFAIASVGIETIEYLLVATGSYNNFELSNHGMARGSVALGQAWLESCGYTPYCDIPDEHHVCEACGRCSFKLHIDETDFSAYPTAAGLNLPFSRFANNDYKISWLVYPPVPGGNLTIDGEVPFIHMLVQAVTDGWLGVGFIAGEGNFGMEGTDVYWGGIDDNGDLVFKDSYTFTIGVPPTDESWGGTPDLYDVAGSREDGILSIEFKRLLDTGDFADVKITSNEQFPCVWAYSSGTDSMDMTRYHRYSRGFMTEHFYSINCLPGEYLMDGQCTPCQAGYFCPDQQTMVPCPAGFYADEPGMVACISCDNSPNVGFANATHSVTCSDCPPNTERTIESSHWGGSRAEECVCQAGFYHPTGQRGQECFPCPPGGYCAGGSHLPRAQPGFWGMLDHPEMFTLCGVQDNGACALATNATVDQWFDDLNTDRDEVLTPSELAGLSTLAPSLAEDDLAAFVGEGARNMSYRQFLGLVAVETHDVASYVPFSDDTRQSLCKEGYTGELCAVCEDGYFRFDVGCVQCPSDPAVATLSMIVGVSVVIGLWIVVAKMAIWLESDTFDLLLLFLQCMSLIMSFDLQFHDWINPLAPLFSLAAFNMDILNPTCMMPWTYSASSLLQLFLPVVLLLVAVVRVAVSRYLINRGHAGKHIFGRCLPAVPSDIVKVGNRNVASVTSFFFMVYSELVIKSIAPFQLVGLPDGRMVMKAAPFLEAWSLDHVLLQVIPGVLGSIVYALVLPALALYHIYQLKKEHQLANDDTLERFHWLYGKYHLKAFYWETIILARRFILCVVLIVLYEWPMTQGMVALGFLVGLLCAQFYTLPFRRDSNNMIDTLFIAVLIVVNFAGLMFEAEIEFPDFVALLVLLAVGGGIGIGIWRTVKEITSTLRRRRGEKLVRLPDHVIELFADALFKSFSKLNAQELNNIIHRIATKQHPSRTSESAQRRSSSQKPEKSLDCFAERVVEDIESEGSSNSDDDDGNDMVCALPKLSTAQNLHAMQNSFSSRRLSTPAQAFEDPEERRRGSLRMFPRVGTLQSIYTGKPESRPLKLQDVQAILQNIASSTWEELRKSSSKPVTKVLTKYESALRRSATVHDESYWENSPPSSPSRTDAATETKHDQRKKVVAMLGGQTPAARLLDCILSATQSRSSLLWASEVFDEARRLNYETYKLASRQASRKTAFGRSAAAPVVVVQDNAFAKNTFAKRRNQEVTAGAVVKFLRRLQRPQIKKDLRECLKAHPWRASAFSNFLTVNCVEGEVNVKAMEKFYKLQSWLSNYMSDTSDTSVFNDTPNAEFYRQLVSGQPHLVDWLFQARPEQVEQFRCVMTELELYSEHWHELREGREGLEIFRQRSRKTRGKLESRRLKKLNEKSVAKRTTSDVVHRDHLASILHWVLFDKHAAANMDQLRDMVSMLYDSKGHAITAMKSRISVRHQKTISKIKQLLSKKAFSKRRATAAGNNNKVAPQPVSAPLQTMKTDSVPHSSSQE